MLTYKYSPFVRLIYRYANIVVTIFLSFYVATSFLMMFEKWQYVFVLIVNLLIIFYMNRFYVSSYRLFPFKIKCDNEKLICSDYFFSNKVIEIKLKDITKITGGIFSGWPTKPVYLYDEKRNITIGFYAHLGKHNILFKTILQNISGEVYEELLAKMKSLKGLK